MLGCKTQTKETSVYIGGEIINPHSNFVLILKNETIIDTLFIHSDNSFGKRIYGLPSGLYSFKHGYEFQYIYLDPLDSIKFRLNTWDFDETIVFEGKGAAKNELLINLFLENEKELKNFYSYFSLKENKFQEKINTLFNRQKEQLISLQNTREHLSKEYLHIADAAINFPIYRLKELYPYYHKKLIDNDSLPIVSDLFYSYREHLNLNDDSLMDFLAYQSFITTYFYNKAYYKNEGNTNNSRFYELVMSFISNEISNESVKNDLLQREMDYLFINKPELLDSIVLTTFYTNCTDSLLIKNFKQVIEKKESLPIFASLPSFEVFTIDGTHENILTLTKNKNVVLYFWSQNNVSDEYLSKRISYLINKHPNITFIGINTDSNTNQHSLCQMKLQNQYFLTKTSQGSELISSQYPRAILINSSGKVKSSFTVLTSSCIDEQINELTSK